MLMDARLLYFPNPRDVRSVTGYSRASSVCVVWTADRGPKPSLTWVVKAWTWTWYCVQGSKPLQHNDNIKSKQGQNWNRGFIGSIILPCQIYRIERVQHAARSQPYFHLQRIWVPNVLAAVKVCVFYPVPNYVTGDLTVALVLGD